MEPKLIKLLYLLIGFTGLMLLIFIISAYLIHYFFQKSKDYEA